MYQLRSFEHLRYLNDRSSQWEHHRSKPDNSIEDDQQAPRVYSSCIRKKGLPHTVPKTDSSIEIQTDADDPLYHEWVESQEQIKTAMITGSSKKEQTRKPAKKQSNVTCKIKKAGFNLK